MFIIALGGLSESGKSSIGVYLQKKGFNRIKIINIEKEMMIERGIISNGDNLKEHHFDLLYEDTMAACHDFLQKLERRMQKSDSLYGTIESIYRPELNIFLKKALMNQYLCFYFEAPMSMRIKREWIRLRKEEGYGDIDIQTVSEFVKKKDTFKIKHHADQIKESADYIIDNSKSKEHLIEEVNNILNKHNITIW